MCSSQGRSKNLYFVAVQKKSPLSYFNEMMAQKNLRQKNRSTDFNRCFNERIIKKPQFLVILK